MDLNGPTHLSRGTIRGTPIEDPKEDHPRKDTEHHAGERDTGTLVFQPLTETARVEALNGDQSKARAKSRET